MVVAAGQTPAACCMAPGQPSPVRVVFVTASDGVRGEVKWTILGGRRSGSPPRRRVTTPAGRGSSREEAISTGADGAVTFAGIHRWLVLLDLFPVEEMVMAQSAGGEKEAGSLGEPPRIEGNYIGHK